MPATASAPDTVQHNEAVTKSQMYALLDRMEHLRAASPAGIAARAGSLAQHSGEWAFSFDAQGTITGRLLAYLMRDAAALGGAGAASSACSDTALIALCATFHRQHAEAYDEANLDWEAADNARHDTARETDRLVATTQAGHRAKAAVVVVLLDENRFDGELAGDFEAIYALNLLRDWLGRA